MLKVLQKEIKKLADAKRAKVQQGYFKTAKGEYAEGDVFVGVRVPDLRKLARRFKGLPIEQQITLLKSKIHEERLLALFLLIQSFESDEGLEKKIYHLYLRHTQYVNNWDLVDSSAHRIVGAYLNTRDRSPLLTLAKSKNLWRRRIAIMSTFYFIKQNDFQYTLRLCDQLLRDQQDLIHKACGWMLREVGKRDKGVLQEYLKSHYADMARTQLRYAIEKFPAAQRQKYLLGKM